MYVFAGTLIAAAVASACTIGAALAGEANNCILKVDGMTYIEGDCTFDDDGAQINVAAPEGISNHRARVQLQPNGSASVWWNGSRAENDEADIALGRLERRGKTCWASEQARLCFTSLVTTATSAADEPMSEELAAENEEEIAGDQEEYGRSQASSGPDFGSAFDEASGAASITCLFADEEILPPNRRIMARGMGGRSYTGHIPKIREFRFDGEQSVTVAGATHPIIWQDGSKVAIRTMTKLSASSVMPGMTEEQAAELQRGLDKMREYQGQTSGLDDRVIVLDFDVQQAIVATISGDALTERQPLRCQ